MLASMLSHELRDFRITSVHPVPKESDQQDEPLENLTPFVWLSRVDTVTESRHINCHSWVGRDPEKFTSYES